MRRVARETGFAVMAWLVPFAMSVCLFPLKTSRPPLFDTLMGVTLTTSTVVLACLYFRRVHASYVRHGIRIGAFWAAANWLLDGLMFSSGPMKMSLDQYLMDIGLAYLAIPAITVGMGLVVESRLRDRHRPELPRN